MFENEVRIMKKLRKYNVQGKSAITYTQIYVGFPRIEAYG
jgi:hypothetical protein